MRILIADDNEWVRRGVKSILAPVAYWEVCGEANDGTEAVQKEMCIRDRPVAMGQTHGLPAL